ncbi:MAG TPA: hypothetical protein VMZ91_07595 [Candidatus Paceibacterota bacterium]|nr:hypothetical protein [Candidatus Paceibacterota bacterium]
MAVLALEHFLFREYSIAVKTWLSENTHLSAYSEEENVTVVYTTPEKAWAKYIYPVINGATISPNINFHLTNYEYKEGENLLGFVREFKLIENSVKGKNLKPPLIYGLTYHTTIYTRLQSHMDVLLYQILSRAHKNAKAVFEVDGQWCEMVATNPTDENELEPGETKDVANRFGLDLVIMRAYLPLDYIEVNRATSTEFEFDI